MTSAQYRMMINTSARMQELADCVGRLALVDSRLLEADFVAETLASVATDLRTLASAIKKLIVFQE